MTRPLNRRHAGGFWRQVILNVGALLGAFCILATLAATVFGITPLVFRSGSMAPKIPTGALALSRTVPADRIQVGDVVSVVNQDGVRVTHRVAGIHLDGSTASLTLKGDANQAADLQPYRVTSVKRVLLSVPRLGYLVAAASTRAGVFVGVAFVVLMLFLGFSGPRRDTEDDPGRDGRERTSLRGRGGLVLVAVAALAAGAIAVPLVPTMAYFTATATLSAPISAAATFPGLPPAAPSITACSRNSSSGDITVRWSSASGASGYSLILSGHNPIAYVTSPYTTTVLSKNETGYFVVQAVNSSGTSNSDTWYYDGRGSNQDCHS